MRPIEYFPLSIKKKAQIWLILQGGIVILVECIFFGQNGLRLGCLNREHCFDKMVLSDQIYVV